MQKNGLKYSVVRLIRDEMNLQRLDRRALAVKMGYCNQAKGLRKLDRFFETGMFSTRSNANNRMVKKAGEALGLSFDRVEEALKETSRQMMLEKEAWERSIFKPHIYIKTEWRHPKCSIVMAALSQVAKNRVIEVDSDVALRSIDEQNRVIKEIIKKHYKDNNKELNLYGKIKGYIWRITYDESFHYSVDGKKLKKGGKIFESSYQVVI